MTRLYNHSTLLWAMTLALAGTITLTGCMSGGNKAFVIPRAVVNPNVVMPNDISEQKDLLDVKNLASLPRQNLFASLLIVDIPVETKAPVVKVAVAPPKDPFSGVSLAGLMYNPRRPVAIISIGSSKDSSGSGGSAASPSRIVHVGDTLPGENGDIEIASIQRDHVVLRAMNADPRLSAFQRTHSLYVPSLIGFKKGSDSTSSSKDKSSGSATDASATANAANAYPGSFGNFGNINSYGASGQNGNGYPVNNAGYGGYPINNGAYPNGNNNGAYPSGNNNGGYGGYPTNANYGGPSFNSNPYPQNQSYAPYQGQNGAPTQNY